MSTITQTITALPDAPDPAADTPTVFSTKAAASVLAQKAMVTELNTFAGQVNTVAGEVADHAAAAAQSAEDATTNGAEQVALAAIQAGNAATSAAAAAGSAIVAGAVVWVSGTAYAIGDARYSPVDLQTYRRKTNGAGTTDPSLDAVNWEKAIKVGGIANIATATTDTTLTSIPTLLQITPASYGVAVTLPDATTCVEGGPLHIIDNKSSFAVFVKNNSGTIIDCVGGKTVGTISLTDNATADGTWSVAGKSGLVLLSESVATGAAYVACSLSPLFEEYQLHMSGVMSGANNVGLYMYGSKDGGSTWIDSNYSMCTYGASTSGVISLEQLTAQSQYSLSYSDARPYALSYNLSGIVNLLGISNRFSSVLSHLRHYTGSLPTVATSGGQIDAGVGGSVNAIKVMFSGNNISGTFRLYGVKK